MRGFIEFIIEIHLMLIIPGLLLLSWKDNTLIGVSIVVFYFLLLMILDKLTRIWNSVNILIIQQNQDTIKKVKD